MLRLPYRVREWDADFAVALQGLQERFPGRLVWCGDLNVAEHPIDVYDPVKQKGKGCFTLEERGCFGEICKRLDLVDSFRHLHPKLQEFSFYSFRFNSVATHRGWRLDYLMVSRGMVDAIKDASILTTVDGDLGHPKRISDHLPITLTLEI